MKVEMTSTKLCGLVLIMTLVNVHSVPLDLTTSRSLQFSDSVERIRNQVMEVRQSSDDLVLDTRTPPKFKFLARKKDKKDSGEENSHAGIAIPIDEDSMKIEETTKKLHFYKFQRPTTNSGLSTWILLSGEPSSTTPKTSNDSDNLKIVAPVGSRVKPMFKKRTTTKKPITQSNIQNNTKTTTEMPTKRPKPTPNLVKIKASALANVQKKKITNSPTNDVTDNPVSKTKTTSTTSVRIAYTVPTKNVKTEKPKEQTFEINKSVNNSSNTPSTTKVQILNMEAKEGDIDITESPIKNDKKKKNKTKKNRNKNKRKKPQDKITKSNSTRIVKNKNALKEKPLGTQLYNYLSREMMPTIGVGLVGLMVTAGLASYFLYPFGAARRIYEVDRKDKGGSYNYNDIYSGGIAEEEALGKVIAGMPFDKLQSSFYKSPTTRKATPPSSQEASSFYPNYKKPQTQHFHQSNIHNYQTHHHHHNKQRGVVHGTVESVPIGPSKGDYLTNHYEKDSYQPITYRNQNSELIKDNEINNEKKFVVGNVPKDMVEEITPAAVPEHGPRMLKIRRRRDVDVSENDIYNDNDIIDRTNISSSSTTSNPLTSTMFDNTITTEILDTTTPNNATESLENKMQNIVNLIKDIFHLKLNLGLDLVKNTTRSISTYIEKVQQKLNRHYRNSQKHF